MATISQLPAPLTLNAVAGNPATLQFTVNVTGENGSPVPWSDISDYAMTVTDQYGQIVNNGQPTVTSDQDNQVRVEWTADQTASIGQDLQCRMSFSVYVSGVGPYALASGQIVMTPASFSS